MSRPVKVELLITYADDTQVFLVLDEDVEVNPSGFTMSLYPERTRPQWQVSMSGRGSQRILRSNQPSLEGLE